jgi:hypothetical protein
MYETAPRHESAVIVQAADIPRRNRGKSCMTARPGTKEALANPQALTLIAILTS